MSREINISQSADQIVALLESGNLKQAIEMRENLKEGQPAIIQEALDRLVAVRGEEHLNTLSSSSSFITRMVVRNLNEQLEATKGEPRMLSAAETENLTEAQRYDVYSSMIQTRGTPAAHTALENNERVILGLRQETQTTANSGRGEYDDLIVVVWRDEQGVGHAQEFSRASTEPTAQYDQHYRSDNSITSRGSLGEDVNNDGVMDLGRLASNVTIEMRATTHGRDKNRHFALRPSDNAVSNGQNMVQRDTNGDGYFDNNDLNGYQDLNNTFKIHRGSRNNTDSAGCQTIHRDDYNNFITAVRGNANQNRWQYVLTGTHSEPGLQNRSFATIYQEMTTLSRNLNTTQDPLVKEQLTKELNQLKKEMIEEAGPAVFHKGLLSAQESYEKIQKTAQSMFDFVKGSASSMNMRKDNQNDEAMRHEAVKKEKEATHDQNMMMP